MPSRNSSWLVKSTLMKHSLAAVLHDRMVQEVAAGCTHNPEGFFCRRLVAHTFKTCCQFTSDFDD